MNIVQALQKRATLPFPAAALSKKVDLQLAAA